MHYHRINSDFVEEKLVLNYICARIIIHIYDQNDKILFVCLLYIL